MLIEMVLTALAAVLLSFLVAKLVSAVVGGGEVREREAAALMIAEGSEGGVVGEKVERVAVVDRFEVVEDRCRSEMLAAAEVVYGVGKDLEREGGGDEEVETAVVEGEEKVESRQFVEVLESGLMEVEEIGGGVGEEGGSGVELGNENSVSCLDEVACSAEDGCVDEIFEDKEGGEAKAMDVENADSGQEEMEIELKDEVADRIEECIRNLVNERCENQCEETAEAKDVVDCIGLVIGDENSVIEGGENQFQEMGGPVDVAKRIALVIGEERIANEGYKSQDDEPKAHKDVNLQLKSKFTEGMFGSSEEDDDWEGIEMSELYNEYKSAAALVRKEERDGKFSNTSSELKMELYGLQKIVMEGPCCEAQPMAIKMSARAKWYKTLLPT